MSHGINDGTKKILITQDCDWEMLFIPQPEDTSRSHLPVAKMAFLLVNKGKRRKPLMFCLEESLKTACKKAA